MRFQRRLEDSPAAGLGQEAGGADAWLMGVMAEALGLIEKRRGTGVPIDSSLLLLHLVGTVNLKRIATSCQEIWRTVTVVSGNSARSSPREA